MSAVTKSPQETMRESPVDASTVELANLGVPPAGADQPKPGDGSAATTTNGTSTTTQPADTDPADIAPDGGRQAWIMTVCSSIVCFFFVGVTYSFGVMQAALVDRGLAPASTLAFIGSISICMLAVLAMVNTRLLGILGARKMCMAGVTFMGLGQILASFCTHNLAGLFLTAGVLMGWGVSMCFITVSITPVQYFTTKRGTAVGIIYAGGGLGGAVISLSLEAGVRHLGVEWTFRLVGLVMLAVALPAAWFIKERFTVVRKQFVDWTLFKQLDFNLLFIAGVFGTFPLIVPPFFLPLYAQSLKLSPTLGAILVSVWNFASAVGRVFTGILSDRLLGPVNTLLFILLLLALSLLAIWPASTSFGPVLIFSLINGAASGGFFSIMPTVVASVMGTQRMAVAFSMVVSGWAGGYIAGAPIAGFLLAAFGGEGGGIASYRPAMWYAGGMAAAAAVAVAYLRYRKSPHLMIKM